MRAGRLVIACFIDGLGWELLRGRRFLDDLLIFRKPVRTTFGYSSTCVPTILTGRVPRVHGHFSSFFYDPVASPFGVCRWLDWLPSALTDRGRVRRQLSRVLARWYGFEGYFQLYGVPFRCLPFFDYAEKHDIFQVGGINGGVHTFLDVFRDHAINLFLADWRTTEQSNLSNLSATIDRGEIAFAFLYLAALDGVLHAVGTSHEAVDRKIDSYARSLVELVERAERRYGEVRVHVFSDHGMADVTHSCDVALRIQNTGLRFGEDYVAMYDSTMARFWFPRLAARRVVEDALREEPEGRILTDAELEDWGCDFAGRKYGELFFLVDSGVLICPGFMGRTMLKGMHGYHPDHRDSVAAYASNSIHAEPPQALTDLFGLLCREVVG